MFAFPVLLGDIGGTNARFAILSEPGGAITFLPRALTAATPTPVEAIAAALRSTSAPPPRSAIIAVATRVDSTAIRLTNAEWVIDAAAIGSALGLERVVLVNDYTPVAASVVALSAARNELVALGSAVQPSDEGARVVLGPGTGLGVAALIPVEQRLVIVATEAGHMEFGPMTEEEHAFWPFLERLDGRVSAEVVLSGPGLLRIATALCRSRGERSPFTAPAEVFEAGHEGRHPLAARALRVFARFLGRFAGDLALTFEANGGVFIAGGIAPRMVDILTSGVFREAFDSKAPHSAWAAGVPAFAITHPEPALQGLAVLAADSARFVFRFQEWRAA